MKIEEVRNLIVGDMHFVIVRTNTGLQGIGQSACWAYPSAVAAVVDSCRPALLGADPTRMRYIQQLLSRMGPFRGSILHAALSAVDIALWDVTAKALEIPVTQLMGGHVRDRIRLCAILEGPGTEALVEQAAAAVADGFTAVKISPLPSDHFDLSQAELAARTVECVGAVRSVIGTRVDLVVEFLRQLTPAQAVPIIEALKPMYPMFVEDPIQLDSAQAQAAVAAMSGVPHGLGERLHTIHEFRELLVNGGLQYVRPDLGAAGGFTGVLKIAGLAEAHHVEVVPHNFFGPVLTAASAAVDACIPNFAIQEYTLRDESIFHRGITSSWRRDGGYLTLSKKPGIGIDFDEAGILATETYEDYMGGRLLNPPRRQDGSLGFAT